MNSSFLESCRHRSLDILSDIYPSFVVFMVAGVVATLTGVLSFAAILRSKEMKSKFYALYVEMSIVDFLMGVSYVFTAARKIYRLNTGRGDVTDRWACCQESAILYFSQTLGLYVAFTLAVDRTVSFVQPVTYKYLKAVYITLPLIVAAWSFSALETLIMLVAGNTPEKFAAETLISCGTASCWSIRSYFATLYSHLAISAFVVLLNFCLIFVAKSLMKEAIKRKAISNLTEDERRLRSQNHFQMKVIKTLSVMVVSHATSHISSRLLLVVLLHLYYSDPELTVLGSCARNLVVINAALHFFFYYATSSEFHAAVNETLAALFCRRSYQTSATGDHNHHHHHHHAGNVVTPEHDAAGGAVENFLLAGGGCGSSKSAPGAAVPPAAACGRRHSEIQYDN